MTTSRWDRCNASRSSKRLQVRQRSTPIGYCIGGTLLSMAMPYLVAKGDDERSTLPPSSVALQDFTEVGDTSVFIDEPQISLY